MTALDDNIAKLDGYLARFRDTGILNRIAGKDVAGSAGVFQSTSPVDKSATWPMAPPQISTQRPLRPMTPLPSGATCPRQSGARS